MQMKTRHNQTALHLVASSCSPTELERATKLLIQNLVDPNDRDDDGKTMMHYINERKDININLKETINSTFITIPQLFSPRLKGSNISQQHSERAIIFS